MKTLILGKNWPESKSSAAGKRTLDLIQIFQSAGWPVHVASDAQRTEYSDPLPNVTCHNIKMNDSSFDTWIQELNPELVVFDRFMTEEQYGWRVTDFCPNAMRVLDTSDLHCLRKAREEALKTGGEPDLFNDTALREIASIYRCDLTLMISPVEVDILKTQFRIPDELLHHLPFLAEPLDNNPGFEERQHMMFIGGFLHAPNVDAVEWLYKDIWPLIRKQLPDVECHIYGAYAPERIQHLNNPSLGFLIKGRCDDVHQTMQQYRINLAPLRYGAGNKGKILDGFVTGTPTVTTDIGAEGMSMDMVREQPRIDDSKKFARLAVELYEQKQQWKGAGQSGYKILEAANNTKKESGLLVKQLIELKDTLKSHRHSNLYGRALNQQQYRASEFMSRWIEAKNS